MEGQSILVVDDEPEMREALSHCLAQGGYSVVAASNGIEALHKFEEEKFDAVITDLKMPDFSGMALLEEVKKISSGVPVILITAYGTIDNAVEAMKQGATDYILKPFSSEVLRATVEKACKNAGSPGITKGTRGHTPQTAGDKRIITQDPALLKVLKLAKNVAPSNATVLILGESGTGKELLASFIHENSDRKGKPYVAVNCAALPETLAESELFGHEKGAFTGAVNRKAGKFELANKGTILLDEISEMSLPLQAKLLRVLQEREIDRVGGSKCTTIDVRVVAISNVDLKEAVREGKFREDLFYRVNVIPLTIPPLRHRKTDISLLAEYFLKKYSTRNGRPMEGIADETISLLSKYDWKGNVRELENTIERAVLMGEGKILSPKHLFLQRPEHERDRNMPIRVGASLRQVEKELILKTLQEVNDNRTHAAKMLGISIRTLRNKLREYKCA